MNRDSDYLIDVVSSARLQMACVGKVEVARFSGIPDFDEPEYATE